MIEMITGFLSSQTGVYATGIGAVVLAWVFKKIPNDKIKLIVGKFMFGLGVTVTLGLAKWSVTAKLWNKTIEPWMIDLIDNVVAEGLKQFISGLRSDTKKEETEDA
jgi:hypothetical protein